MVKPLLDDNTKKLNMEANSLSIDSSQKVKVMIDFLDVQPINTNIAQLTWSS
jgi:hypothetical protein